MKVKVLKNSIRFQDKIYMPGETIDGLPDEEIIRLKEMGVIEVLSVDTTDPEYKIQKLQEEISALKNEKDNLTKQNETLTQEKNTLVQQNETLSQEKNSLTEQNKTLTQENTTLKSENEKLKQELENLQQTKSRSKKAE